MPIEPLFDVLYQAKWGQACVPGFNVDSLEMLQGVLQALNAQHRPGFVQVTMETLNIWGADFFLGVMKDACRKVAAPVSLHLDHATRLQDVRWGIDAGFTSVMYDGSALSFEENMANTRQVVQWARPMKVLVEAEIGHVAKPGEPEAWAHLTDPEEAYQFAEQTEVDALAVAVGTHHATRVGSGALDIARLRTIHERCPVPIVLHGSSGVPQSSYPAILPLVAKMNFGTELRRIWWDSVLASSGRKPREALQVVRQEVDTWSQGIVERVNP